MQFPGGASWQVRFEASSLLLHAALFVREACVPVADVDTPPPLLVTPPPARARIDVAAWQEWWSALIEVSDGTPREDLWSLGPAGLGDSLSELDDEVFRWVTRHVRDADRYRAPDFSLPVRQAVANLERRYGCRSLMDVRIEGLAVRGEWVKVSEDGLVVCASWTALDHAQDWLTDALRPAFRRSLSV